MNKSISSNNNLSLLHAIRGIAAFYVVIYHAKFILWSGGREYISQYPRSTWGLTDYLSFAVDMLFSAGSQMVMIFFVLSGFFIASSFKNLTGSLAEKAKTFYTVRIIRIYIPYLASIAVGVTVLFWVQKISPELFQLNTHREFNNRLIAAANDTSFSSFLKALLFEKNTEYIGFNYAYWSLLYEGIFYLIVPVLYLFRKQYLLLSGIFYIAGMFIINIYHPENPFVKFLFEYNFYFAVGQAIYYRKAQLSQLLSLRNYKWRLAGACIGLFLLFNVLALAEAHFWANFLSVITGSLLMLLFMNYQMKNSLFIRGIKYLGKISYSLYLVHIPTLVLTYTIFYKFTGKIIFYSHIYYVGVLASVAVAVVFYKIGEEPSLKLIGKVKALFKEPASNAQTALA
ncbi:MAG: acyltransferase [Chitinophagaceae bacterium]|nr:MAG: acyltransferase [Chitinophagaceae bacterium]